MGLEFNGISTGCGYGVNECMGRTQTAVVRLTDFRYN
jgi:hypothetical protein